MKVLIVNGPNLNLLGQREPHVYGSMSLDEIIALTEEKVASFNFNLTWFQSNHEGELIDKIQAATEYEGLVINPGAFTHTSIAILDALKAYNGKIIEVHLSNTYARENFRQVKITTTGAHGVLEGFKEKSYYLALWSLIN